MIKVCGMRDPENIRAVAGLGVDMIGFVFCDKSPYNVQQLHIPAGTIPDRADQNFNLSPFSSQLSIVGVFVDEMPQNIITRVYNYHLDYIQLDGNESPTYIDNLRRSLVPDIAPDIKIIKTINITGAEDIKRWREYEGHIDMFLFDTTVDWSVLNSYDGDVPFLLSGGIAPKYSERVKAFPHPMCIGINVNTEFEDAPAVKNVEKLRSFIAEVKS